MDHLNSLNSHNPNLEYVFVDSSVNDRQDLIAGITPSTPEQQMIVVELDSTLDGIQQIADTLSQYAEQIDAVLVAHGEVGKHGYCLFTD